MTFDPTKPVTLRNGSPARIICTDRKSDQTIIVLYMEHGHEYCLSVLPDGRRNGGEKSPYDLVNIPVRTLGYLNIWKNGVTQLRDSLYPSIKNNDPNYKGTIRVEFVDGVVESLSLMKEGESE